MRKSTPKEKPRPKVGAPRSAANVLRSPFSNHRKQLVVKPKGHHIDILVNAIRPDSGEGHVVLRHEQVIILDAN